MGRIDMDELTKILELPIGKMLSSVDEELLIPKDINTISKYLTTEGVPYIIHEGNEHNRILKLSDIPDNKQEVALMYILSIIAMKNFILNIIKDK